MLSGCLYIVSTPIGNLGDMTYRAVEVLSQANLIAAEDTRVSRVLLNRYEIATPMTSFHAHNQAKKTPSLLNRLKNQDDIALISDAGTPGISDPAYYLVRRAISEEITVQSVPGASALLAGLVVSGMPTHRFVFEGFLPVKKGRKTRLAGLQSEERTIVLYESPHRLRRTLNDLLQFLGNRKITLARELTKRYEEVIRTSLDQAVSMFADSKARGEFVLVIEGQA